MSSKSSKIIFNIHMIMGMYGFTRGYRSHDKINKNERLIAENVSNGLINGYFYCLPLYNFKWIYTFLNRVEVKYRNLDKKMYEKNYEEMYGICDDTI